MPWLPLALSLLVSGRAVEAQDAGKGSPELSAPSLSPEDAEVVENLELLENLDAAEDLDWLLEVSRPTSEALPRGSPRKSPPPKRADGI